MSINRDNKGLFTGAGLGIPKTVKPIAVKFPPNIDEILRTMPNLSDYVRKAVIAKLKADGLI